MTDLSQTLGLAKSSLTGLVNRTEPTDSSPGQPTPTTPGPSR